MESPTEPSDLTLTLTFQGHSRSSVMVSLDSAYMVFYRWLISNIGPKSAPLRYIYGFIIWVTLTLTFQRHSMSNLMMQLHCPYMSSY